jgi:hypothetical protein
VAAGFYRTCLIDGVPEHSPAEHARRPAVPAESPAPGFTHLQFEALLTAARQSVSPPTGTTPPSWPCSACWACGSSKPPARISPTSAKSTATGCCECAARAARSSWSRCHHRPDAPSAGPSAPASPARSCATAAAHAWTGTPPPGGSGGSPRMRAYGSPGHPVCVLPLNATGGTGTSSLAAIAQWRHPLWACPDDRSTGRPILRAVRYPVPGPRGRPELGGYLRAQLLFQPDPSTPARPSRVA